MERSRLTQCLLDGARCTTLLLGSCARQSGLNGNVWFAAYQFGPHSLNSVQIDSCPCYMPRELSEFSVAPQVWNWPGSPIPDYVEPVAMGQKPSMPVHTNPRIVIITIKVFLTGE